jgi:hypothetical protein
MKEFLKFSNGEKINIVRENVSTGERTFSGSAELLAEIARFQRNVLGKNFNAFEINGFKVQPDGSFHFKGGTGYDVISREIFGSKVPVSELFDSFLDLNRDTDQVKENFNYRYTVYENDLAKIKSLDFKTVNVNTELNADDFINKGEYIIKQNDNIIGKVNNDGEKVKFDFPSEKLDTYRFPEVITELSKKDFSVEINSATEKYSYNKENGNLSIIKDKGDQYSGDTRPILWETREDINNMRLSMAGIKNLESLNYVRKGDTVSVELDGKVSEGKDFLKEVEKFQLKDENRNIVFENGEYKSEDKFEMYEPIVIKEIYFLNDNETFKKSINNEVEKFKEKYIVSENEQTIKVKVDNPEEINDFADAMEMYEDIFLENNVSRNFEVDNMKVAVALAENLWPETYFNDKEGNRLYRDEDDLVFNSGKNLSLGEMFECYKAIDAFQNEDYPYPVMIVSNERTFTEDLALIEDEKENFVFTVDRITDKVINEAEKLIKYLDIPTFRIENGDGTKSAVVFKEDFLNKENLENFIKENDIPEKLKSVSEVKIISGDISTEMKNGKLNEGPKKDNSNNKQREI